MTMGEIIYPTRSRIAMSTSRGWLGASLLECAARAESLRERILSTKMPQMTRQESVRSAAGGRISSRWCAKTESVANLRVEVTWHLFP